MSELITSDKSYVIQGRIEERWHDIPGPVRCKTHLISAKNYMKSLKNQTIWLNWKWQEFRIIQRIVEDYLVV